MIQKLEMFTNCMYVCMQEAIAEGRTTVSVAVLVVRQYPNLFVAQYRY